MEETGYDVIGDVHGCADLLEDLLRAMGYEFDPYLNAFAHKTRVALFVGDLVDRGDFQLRTLQLVKAMVDAGTARMVLGNHEFNAIAYATPDPHRPGNYLREHSAKNRTQHLAFLTQLTREQQAYYIAWFRRLPLWLDLGDLRVIHACWHQPSLAVVEEQLGGAVFSSPEQFLAATDMRAKDDPTSLYAAIEVLLKGPELDLSAYGAPSFHDKDGNERSHARIRWWNQLATKVSEIAEIPRTARDVEGKDYAEHHLGTLAKDIQPHDWTYAYNEEIPVIYGHYWREPNPVEHDDWTAHTACVDFSAVRTGALCAYRWSGEAEIDESHYFPQAPETAHHTTQ